MGYFYVAFSIIGKILSFCFGGYKIMFEIIEALIKKKEISVTTIVFGFGRGLLSILLTYALIKIFSPSTYH